MIAFAFPLNSLLFGPKLYQYYFFNQSINASCSMRIASFQMFILPFHLLAPSGKRKLFRGRRAAGDERSSCAEVMEKKTLQVVERIDVLCLVSMLAREPVCCASVIRMLCLLLLSRRTKNSVLEAAAFSHTSPRPARVLVVAVVCTRIRVGLGRGLEAGAPAHCSGLPESVGLHVRGTKGLRMPYSTQSLVGVFDCCNRRKN